MFEIRYLPTFKKSIKLMLKRGYDEESFKVVIQKLLLGEPLEPKYNNHKLKGKFLGFYECHIKPDWLLIYYYDFCNSAIYLVDTGTHSDLFKK